MTAVGILTAIALPSIGLMIIAVGSMCYLIGRSTNRPDAIHTEEVYHGNWWATYHTPRDMLYYNISAGTLLATFLTVCLVGLYVAFTSITWEELADFLSGVFWLL